MNETAQQYSYWKNVWKKFLTHKLGLLSLIVVFLFCLMGIYAPFLASSKPIFIIYDGSWYFPLFRYLFFQGFFTKNIDIFFNILAILLPLFLGLSLGFRKWGRDLKPLLLAFVLAQASLFILLTLFPIKDPDFDPKLANARHLALQQLREEKKYPTWQFELNYMTTYGKLNQVLRYRRLKAQDEKIKLIREKNSAEKNSAEMPTIWQIEQGHEEARLKSNFEIITRYEKGELKEKEGYERAKSSLQYLMDKRVWLKEQNNLIALDVMPLIRPFHWEDDAGGDQAMNQFLPWWDLTRINRKDMIAALIFGVRISLVVGVLAVFLALVIGIPIGSFAGYYGGRFDIVVSRLMEIWESMPTFFMLLFVVAMLQSKSIFIVIAVVGIFGWTSFSRYIRGEFFKQRNLAYVEACHALGFQDSHIIFTHILPNAIPPVLTLLPFAILGAITSEAGLSFLGLGEEGSCSWGVLMDEGRSAFPAESYLLWPPALLLTTLLVAIALVGDALRDVLDPKMNR